ncbi:MAG TPA: hypothetical protein VFE82_11020 [Ramlibacter sp.]|jgi:hypothetical protein|uniref:hypothetical protein n=1 Tax=Ramlibacter sp. TaxID=1917967 RepID=UPI002D6AD975|nr:hypothetical protein [Ramlibacter sp.]HZY19004.1 hypothetical protein [Ramlibacter sp.]
MPEDSIVELDPYLAFLFSTQAADGAWTASIQFQRLDDMGQDYEPPSVRKELPGSFASRQAALQAAEQLASQLHRDGAVGL